MAESGLRPRDLKEINKASQHALKGEDELAELISRVDNMGSLSLWWDSKVPENEKGFFNFISFKTSDPEVMKKEIILIKDFYGEMKDVLKQVRNSDNQGVDALIEQLYDKLKKMAEEAELKVDTTDSSALYHMYYQFISQQTRTEAIIKRVENVALRQQLQNVTKRWNKALQTIASLKADLQEFKENHTILISRFDQLMTAHEALTSKHDKLMDDNAAYMSLIQNLLPKREP